AGPAGSSCACRSRLDARRAGCGLRHSRCSGSCCCSIASYDPSIIGRVTPTTSRRTDPRTMGALPACSAARWGTREALCFNDRRLSFSQIAAGVDRVAKGLVALGIHPGDKVALWMLNRPEWIEAAFAVMKIGAVLVPVNTRLRTEDVAYIVDQSDSIALILAERSGPVDYLGMVRELKPLKVAPSATRLPKLRHLVVLGDEPAPETVAWPGLLAGGDAIDNAALAARAAVVDPGDLAFLMYTSGTTGFPKGAMHDHALIANVEARAFRLAI